MPKSPELYSVSPEENEPLRRFYNYLKPQPVGLDGQPLPTTTGPELYRLLDNAGSPLVTIGAIVRSRYPFTAGMVDADLHEAVESYWATPTPSDEAWSNYKQALGKVGAFNFIRSMKDFTIPGTEIYEQVGEIDRKRAPRMMLSPSASIQVLEHMSKTMGRPIGPTDNFLELYSGTNYFTMFPALYCPGRLDCVDLHTPGKYDLQRTFDTAYRDIFQEMLPEDLWPDITMPNFIEADCVELDKVPGQTLADKYDVVFMAPPFGRESTLIMPDISEAQGFVLWVDSIISARKMNYGNPPIFSVVPTEWLNALKVLKDGGRLVYAIEGLYKELAKLEYYHFNEARKERLRNKSHNTPVNDWQNLRNIVADDSNLKLEETGMFSLSIHNVKAAKPS